MPRGPGSTTVDGEERGSRRNARASDSQASDEDLPYDPNQNAEVKRNLRRHYRELGGDELLQNAGSAATAQLAQTLKQATNLFKNVKDLQTATFDSSVLLKVTNSTTEKARQMRAGAGGLDVEELVRAFVAFMGGNRPDKLADDEDEYDSDVVYDGGGDLEWDKIGRLAMAKSRRVPALDFMHGVLMVEPKKRKQTQRTQREKFQGQQTQPQEIRQQDVTKSENETSANVVKLSKLLEEGERMNIFRCIINPDSYGQSVENLFYLSFLIRDGMVSMDFDEESKEPMIMLCEKADAAAPQTQMITELDMETWRMAIEVFDIKESFFPTRMPAMQRMGDKWYG